uniref:Uncharacterized protein n=1 Tax=Lactuca sativa TaxID=4236 RepID=A0A9R1W847_LACSA|nr:hypothetical protein LSAT_V11C300130160 [Lactuca sativa]
MSMVKGTTTHTTQIEGEECKQANLKVLANAYLKQESTNSHYRHCHKECNDGSHDKHSKYSRHSSHRFLPFVKDETISHKMEVHAIEKPLNGRKKRKADTANTTRAKPKTLESA